MPNVQWIASPPPHALPLLSLMARSEVCSLWGLPSPSLRHYRPFDSNLYEDEVDEDEVLDEEGRARLKLKVRGE